MTAFPSIEANREALEAIAAGKDSALAEVTQPEPQSPVVTAAEFRSTPREPLVAYLSTHDGRSVLLARETMLLIAGPSGVGKSLAGSFELAGQLAASEPSGWLGFKVMGKLKVLLLSFEGSDDDTADRLALVPDDVDDRFLVWDRWRKEPLPDAVASGIARLADVVRESEIDVLVFDTAVRFLSTGYDCSKGVPEHAFEAIEQIRDLSGRRHLAVVGVVHTRKADRNGASVDELEEIAGTFGKKADAAVVIRREGESKNKRRVKFVKVRRGPEPGDLIATLPPEDSDEPPHLTLVATVGPVGRPMKSPAEEMADWIKAQAKPIPSGVIRAQFDISSGTLKDRRPMLAELGIKHSKVPRAANQYAYGTNDQWAELLGGMLRENRERPA